MSIMALTSPHRAATIGGTTTGAGNIISGNTESGLYIDASCLVEGNLIGTNAAGTGAVAKEIRHDLLASGATIGGTTDWMPLQHYLRKRGL